MHEEFESTDNLGRSNAAASSALTRWHRWIVAMLGTLRIAWRDWQSVRQARAREETLRQQLKGMDRRMLDDIGIPTTRVPAEPSGSAMSRAIDIEIRERMQRQLVARPASPAVEDGVERIVPAPRSSAPMPENSAMGLENLAAPIGPLKVVHVTSAIGTAYRRDACDDWVGAAGRPGDGRSHVGSAGTIRAANR